MQQYKINNPEELASMAYAVKFVRRPDLTADIRHKIASRALHFAPKGKKVVEKLSAQYGISRQFIYDLSNRLEQSLPIVFAPPVDAVAETRQKWLASVGQVIHLRLVGRSSLEGISEMLGSFGASYTSVGFVSGTLKKLGAALPNTVGWQGATFYASDEVFRCGRCPILATVDPRSGAILRLDCLDSLTKEAWVQHWETLKAQGILPLGLTADEGVALRAARLQAMEQVPWQPDTFHAIAHRLGVIGRRLQRQAETAIEHEYLRQSMLQGAEAEKARAGQTGEMGEKAKKKKKKKAKPAGKPEKFAGKLTEARQASREAIQTADGFHFLYRCILAQLNVFDQKGEVRSRQKAEAEVRCAIELMRQVNASGLAKELDDLEKVLPNLFNFLDKAVEVSRYLQPITGELELPFWTTAWTNLKKAQKSKDYAKQKMHRQRAESFLDMLKEHYNDDAQAFCERQKLVFANLDHIVQSSAVVENVNAFIRSFLDQARDQISQETLNLIMFYYNHKIHKRGKRRGMAPIEILSGEKLQKPWHEILMDIAAKL